MRNQWLVLTREEFQHFARIAIHLWGQDILWALKVIVYVEFRAAIAGNLPGIKNVFKNRPNTLAIKFAIMRKFSHGKLSCLEVET